MCLILLIIYEVFKSIFVPQKKYDSMTDLSHKTRQIAIIIWAHPDP